MAATPDNESRTLDAAIFGMMAGLVTGELGRLIAVVGAMIVGFYSLARSSNAGSNEWAFLMISVATFCSLVWLCRE